MLFIMAVFYLFLFPGELKGQCINNDAKEVYICSNVGWKTSARCMQEPRGRKATTRWISWHLHPAVDRQWLMISIRLSEH